MLDCFRLFSFAQFLLRMPGVDTEAAGASPMVVVIIRRAMAGTIRAVWDRLTEAAAIGTSEREIVTALINKQSRHLDCFGSKQDG